MIIWPPSVDLTLSSSQVSLSAYTSADAGSLRNSLASEQVWEHIPAGPTGPRDWDLYMASGARTGRFPFVVRLGLPLNGLAKGAVVGSTSFYDVSPEHLHLSVGYTTYQPEVWGSWVNPACKLLLLRFAFEELGMHRVQLKTDDKNIRSQLAMEKMGATKEGVLRQHMLRNDGTMRDSVVYSIVRSEWQRTEETLSSLVITKSKPGGS